MSFHSRKTSLDLRMPKNDSIMPLSVLLPLQGHRWLNALSSKNYDKTHAGIAIPDHYGE